MFLGECARRWDLRPSCFSDFSRGKLKLAARIWKEPKRRMKNSAGRRNRLKKRLTRLITRCASVFLAFLLASCATVSGKAATLSMTEKDGLKSGSPTAERTYTQSEVDAMIDELREIAEEEMERTAQEAVKAAVVKIGSECAAQETEAESYASLCERLEEENSALVLENERLKKHGLKNVFAGTAVGAGVGIAFTSLLFLLFGVR